LLGRAERLSICLDRPLNTEATRRRVMSSTGSSQLSHRAIAILRAVAAGRAELTSSCEPDLRVDSLLCCDQVTARYLFHSGLVQPTTSGTTGQWTTARLTPAGENTLARVDTDRRHQALLTAV
jgi:hypothetical protein